MTTPKFQKGDVYFVMHHDETLSKIIAWFMQSQWSHCGFVLDGNSPDRTYVSETSDYEVTLAWIERYLIDPNCSIEVWRPTQQTPEQIDTVANRLLQNQESLYAYWQLLSFALKCLLARIKINIPNLLPWGYICDQHVLSGEVLIPTSGVYGLAPHQYQTQQWYEMMQASNAYTLIYKQ